MTDLAQTNGKHIQPESEAEIVATMNEQLTAGYKPSIPVETMFGPDGSPILSNPSGEKWIVDEMARAAWLKAHPGGGQ